MIRLFAVGLLLWGLGVGAGLGVTPAGAVVMPNDGAIHQTVRDVLGDADYQTDLPGGRTGGGGEVDPPKPLPQKGNLTFFQLPAEILGVVLRIAGLAGLVLLVVYMVREAPRLFGQARRELDHLATLEDDRLASGSSLAGAVGLVEADLLAERGYYGEAVRLLLLGCLEDLRRAFRLAHFASMTSREILVRVTLPEALRVALMTIVSAEELSQFGGRACNEAIWRTCRESYQQFSAGLGATA